MYKDIISYELAEGITEEHLFEVAEKVYNDWMKNQRGFLGWEINKNSNGSYTDIVMWESKEDNELSNKNMSSMEHSGDWIACYNMSTVKSFNLQRLFNK